VQQSFDCFGQVRRLDGAPATDGDHCGADDLAASEHHLLRSSKGVPAKAENDLAASKQCRSGALKA